MVIARVSIRSGNKSSDQFALQCTRNGKTIPCPKGAHNPHVPSPQRQRSPSPSPWEGNNSRAPPAVSSHLCTSLSLIPAWVRTCLHSPWHAAGAAPRGTAGWAEDALGRGILVCRPHWPAWPKGLHLAGQCAALAGLIAFQALPCIINNAQARPN